MVILYTLYINPKPVVKSKCIFDVNFDVNQIYKLNHTEFS